MPPCLEEFGTVIVFIEGEFYSTFSDSFMFQSFNDSDLVNGVWRPENTAHISAQMRRRAWENGDTGRYGDSDLDDLLDRSRGCWRRELSVSGDTVYVWDTGRGTDANMP